MLRAGSITYEPTAADVLWLRRAVEAEGAPQRGVASALVNAFMFVKAHRHWQGSLADYVRAYSKPVNPAWFPEGELFRVAHRSAQPDVRDKMLKDAERRRDVHARRTDFMPSTEAAVNFALANPPPIRNATDFAPLYVQRDSQWLALTPPRANENRFWARPGAWDWTGYTTVFVATTPTDSGGVGVAVVVAVLALVVALAMARKG